MASRMPRDNSGVVIGSRGALIFDAGIKREIKKFVPGHGPMGKLEAIDRLIDYPWWLLREVDEAIRLGLTRDAAIEAITLPNRFLVSRFSPASRSIR